MKQGEDELERELRIRLRRVEAPGSLAGSVVERLAAEPQRVLAFPKQMGLGRIAAVFALAALLLGGGLERHRAKERARAEQDFAKSLEITNRALEPMRRQLQRAGITLDE